MKIDISQPIIVPREVAVCPSCGGDVQVEPIAWCEDAAGLHVAEFYLHCAAEPELAAGAERQAWEDQHARGFAMPYVYWLPLEMRVEAWLKTVEIVDSAADRRQLARWNAWAAAAGAQRSGA